MEVGGRGVPGSSGAQGSCSSHLGLFPPLLKISLDLDLALLQQVLNMLNLSLHLAQVVIKLFEPA